MLVVKARLSRCHTMTCAVREQATSPPSEDFPCRRQSTLLSCRELGPLQFSLRSQQMLSLAPLLRVAPVSRHTSSAHDRKQGGTYGRRTTTGRAAQPAQKIVKRYSTYPRLGQYYLGSIKHIPQKHRRERPHPYVARYGSKRSLGQLPCPRCLFKTAGRCPNSICIGRSTHPRRLFPHLHPYCIELA